MSISNTPANTRNNERAVSIVEPDLGGDPNLLNDERIDAAVPGSWFIPFDKPNTRWQKINTEDNLWVEFLPDVPETFKVKVSDGDAEPAFLSEKIKGTAGAEATNLIDEFLIIDTRRTSFMYG